LAIFNVLIARNFICLDSKNKNIQEKYLSLIRYFVLDLINLKSINNDYTLYQNIWNSVLQVNIAEALNEKNS
jgi:hypothetical protein